MKKIVLIGCGAVGNSFLYSAINQGLGQEYILIDKFKEAAEGNAIDLADTQASLRQSFVSIKEGDYPDCKDADVIVITAGRPQKQGGETRLEMVADNAKIMQEIALNVKASGFNGITIIASNPVDVITAVYQKVTGFDPHKVLGAGTTLDTLRIKYLLGQKFNINPKSVSALVMAEHGDSSFIPWSAVTVGNKNINQLLDEKLITKDELNSIEQEVRDRAYRIIELKRATFYGIGAGLAALVRMIKEGNNTITVGGVQLNGEYGNEGLYIGAPIILGKEGWKEIIQLPLTEEEQNKFNKSVSIVKEALKIAYDAIS